MNAGRCLPAADVRSDAYFLAQAVVTCSRCGRPTSVFALALPPGHEHFDHEADVWERAPLGAFLFAVEWLPESVAAQLGDLAPEYRCRRSPGGADGSWVNHCHACGGIQEEHSLHCEPGAPFLPMTHEAAELIQLVEFHAPFSASAAGYSYDLPFMDSMRLLGRV